MNNLFKVLLRFLPLPLARVAISGWYALLVSAVLLFSDHSAIEIVYWDQ